jgi:hypothetical protein
MATSAYVPLPSVCQPACITVRTKPMGRAAPLSSNGLPLKSPLADIWTSFVGRPWRARGEEKATLKDGTSSTRIAVVWSSPFADLPFAPVIIRVKRSRYTKIRAGLNVYQRRQSETMTSKATVAVNTASEVSILKTKAAAKKGLNITPERTEVVWPKPEFVCLSAKLCVHH